MHYLTYFLAGFSQNELAALQSTRQDKTTLGMTHEALTVPLKSVVQLTQMDLARCQHHAALVEVRIWMSVLL